jgi:hypothetical protein
MRSLGLRLVLACGALAVALFSVGVYAQNKVVVITMEGDPPPLKAVTPVAPVDPSQSNYTLLDTGGDETVLDKITDLEWQREDDNDTKTWAEAFDYCDNFNTGPFFAGKTHWRLPTITELQSIVDYGASDPAIEGISFTNTNSSFYWSASSVASFSSLAWLVGFMSGAVGGGLKTSSNYVRCVR